MKINDDNSVEMIQKMSEHKVKIQAASVFDIYRFVLKHRNIFSCVES